MRINVTDARAATCLRLGFVVLFFCQGVASAFHTVVEENAEMLEALPALLRYELAEALRSAACTIKVLTSV